MKFFQFKRTQRKYKSRYRVANWHAYEAGLRWRGSVTIWITEEAKGGWCCRGLRKLGGKRVYSNTAIETFWMVNMIYNLALRQAEGFLESLFDLTGVGLPVPDHPTVSRRVRHLRKVPLMPRDCKTPIHLLVDSSGLRIDVGNSRKPPQKRAWRKIHLAVDGKTGEIMAADLGASRAPDASRTKQLLRQVENPLASFCGDGAYDKKPVYEVVDEHSPNRRTHVIIPPHKGALVKPNATVAMRDRNRHIRSIKRIG